MLISCNWLSRHVDLSGVDLHELGDRFTLNVAELEEIHEVGRGLETVAVGEVLEVHPIEGAHIQRTIVDTGAHGRLQIVCGAPNVAVGQRVPVALPGTKLGDFTIAETQIRGVRSAGMIASEKELGLTDEHEGIMVLEGTPEPGTPLSALIELEDTLFEIDNKSLTHRPDLWGHRGIAREIAAIIGRELKPLALDVPFTEARPLTIRVEDEVACPRYTAITLEGITIAPSPLWLKVLLHRVGTRPISNVVDITNFVMLDIGNPLHAFDRRQVKGDTIVVRRAADGEAFTTLDDQEHRLTAADLLIGDAERGVALAGVMGGQNSEIQDDTSSMVLESANFDAATIRMTAQRLGLRTESSARFEKSLDPDFAEQAARSFCVLLGQLDPGARVTSAFMDVAAERPPLPTIPLRLDRLAAKLGVALPEAQVVGYLRALEFGVEGEGTGTLRVTVPSFRATKDVSIEADLVEEVGRSYGYDNIVPEGPRIVLGRPHPNKRKRFERAVRHYLSRTAGFDEVMTYSFDHDPFLDKIGFEPGPRAMLRNPIHAEMPAMRTHLMPNLLQVLERNSRRFPEVRAYELGRIFRPRGEPGDLPHQPTHLGLLVSREAGGPDPDAELFFALKGVLAGLSRACGRRMPALSQGSVDLVWAHPVRQATLAVDGAEIGAIAEVHPLVLHALDLKRQAAFVELDLDAWRASEVAEPGYTPLPRFPAVFRDFAVVVAGDVPADSVREAIAGASPELISDVTFQSRYAGAGVPEGCKSLAFSVTLRHADRTLKDPEVREVEGAVWSALAERVGGKPRA